MQNVHKVLGIVFSLMPLIAELCLALGVSIFLKSTAHGHFLEDLASELFNIVKDGPDVPYNAQLLHPPLSCHDEPALKGLLRNCKTKGRPQVPLQATSQIQAPARCIAILLSSTGFRLP